MAPSEDLVDEIEAINAIYGDGTLVLTGDDGRGGRGAADGVSALGGATAILALPSSASDVADADDLTAAARRLRLRLWFPADYPACPEGPAVLGVQSAGDSGRRQRPGAAADDAARFGDALASVFQDGQVCVFDAVDAFMQGIEEEEEGEEGENHGNDDDDYDSVEGRPRQRPPTPELPPHLLDPPPPWTVSEPMEELRSVFVARCAPVTSPAQAYAFLQHLLATDRRVRGATHNMTAWRIRDEAAAAAADGGKRAAVTFQDCDDDGETAAGGRLLHLMQLMDLWNVMVVVTRWYGGHKLGPRRFALINQAARDAFVRAGLVPEVKKKQK